MNWQVSYTICETIYDQLTFTIRFIRRCEPVECFMMLTPILSHGAKNLADTVVDFLNYQTVTVVSRMTMPQICLDAILDCSQSVNQLNEFAIYVPSVGHSPNSVWVKAAGCCLKTVKFFDCSKSVFLFLCLYTSTECSSVIFREKIFVFKCLSDTRWSSHFDAVWKFREN